MNRILINEFDVDLILAKYPEWPALDRHEKYRLLKGHDPRVRQEETNVTCVELHKWLAQVINPEKSIVDSVAELLLGDGGTTTSSSDTSLNNQVGKIDLTDSEYDSTVPESHFSFFIDSTQLNGNTLNELALNSNEGRFMNHAAIDPSVDKTNAKTLVIEVIIDVS